MTELPRDKKLVSVVIPAYNEEEVADELCKQLLAFFDSVPRYDWEAVIVENGSHDATFDRLLAWHEKDDRIRVLKLSRNFGCDGGITAGMRHASGDAVVIMMADLQEPLETINKFLSRWEEGYENIYGLVTRREGTGILRKINSQIFYWVVNRLTQGLVRRNASDFRLVDRKVVDEINQIDERGRFMRGMFVWAGFKSIGVEHPRLPRFAGTAKSYFTVVLNLALRGIFAYTTIPLKAITYIGISVSVLSFAILFFIVIRALFWGVPFAGFGTIMGVMLLMFGFLFTMLGIMGEYIGLIYEEVKQRPNFIVDERVGLPDVMPRASVRARSTRLESRPGTRPE